MFWFVAVGAGAALLPDLDTPSSAAGRSLGQVTELVSKKLQGTSRAPCQRTATEVELRKPQDAGNRYLTHTVPAAVMFGLVAMVVSLVPLGSGLVVFAMSALGSGTVVLSMKKLGPLRKRKITALVLAVLFGLGSFFDEGGGPAPWLVGLTVFVGAVTHILGDWLTKQGVPLAWPLKVQGRRWWMFRSPVAVRTGKSKVEVGIMWASWVGVGLMMASVPQPPV